VDRLSWNRRGQWTVYPEDHIGRLDGEATPFPVSRTWKLAGPDEPPTWPWAHDAMELGCNDFRSTKETVRRASLRRASGAGVELVDPAASHHSRSWVDGDSIRWLVAHYNNPGAERFFRSHARVEDRPMEAGDERSDAFTLRLVKP